MPFNELLSIIINGATLIAIVFAVFMYIRNPQEKSAQNDAVYDVKLTNLEALFVNLRDNHFHTIESKLDVHIETQTRNDLILCEKLARIETQLNILIENKYGK